LDSENKEDPIAFWKLRLGDFTAFVRYSDIQPLVLSPRLELYLTK
jgi:hypothetical protein